MIDKVESSETLFSSHFRKNCADRITLDGAKIPLDTIGNYILYEDVLEEQWFESFYILNTVTDEKIFPDSAEQVYILSGRIVALDGFEAPIIEVYGSTHMGNGTVSLYVLENDQLHFLIETRAVDNHREGTGHCLCNDFLIDDGGLTTKYDDINNDGYADIILEGTGLLMKNELPIRRVPMRRVFQWNYQIGQFVEVETERIGFEFYEANGLYF